MNIYLRVRELVGGKTASRRGFISELSEATGIDRHVISDMLNQRPCRIDVVALGRLCDVLVEKYDVDPDLLPGSLLGQVPKYLLDVLHAPDTFHCYLGKRHIFDWQRGGFVSATDAQLQSLLVSNISKAKGTGKLANQMPPTIHLHLVDAPPYAKDDEDEQPNASPRWEDVIKNAEKMYGEIQHAKEKTARLYVASSKVNSLVELSLSRIFNTKAFESQDNVATPEERSVPFTFRYRDREPQPKSCCGGVQLAIDTPVSQAGIFYEDENGKWECCPCEETEGLCNDVAFLYYDFYPNIQFCEMACGGFSSTASNLLRCTFDEVASKMWPPQINTEERRLGMFLIKFTYDRLDRPARLPTQSDLTGKGYEVIRLPDSAIQRRCQ